MPRHLHSELGFCIRLHCRAGPHSTQNTERTLGLVVGNPHQPHAHAPLPQIQHVQEETIVVNFCEIWDP